MADVSCMQEFPKSAITQNTIYCIFNEEYEHIHLGGVAVRHLKCLDSFWEVVFGEGRGYEKSLPSHVKEKLSPKITKASQTQWNSNSMAFIPSLQTFKYCGTSNSWAHPRTAIPTFTQKSVQKNILIHIFFCL